LGIHAAQVFTKVHELYYNYLFILALATASGLATKTLFLALAKVLLLMLPYTNLKPWIPSAFEDLSTECGRYWHQAAGQFYTWNARTRGATWCLPPELWPAFRALLRILVLPADNCSSVWSLFMWSSSQHVRMRTLLLADPCHGSLRHSDFIFAVYLFVCFAGGDTPGVSLRAN